MKNWRKRMYQIYDRATGRYMVTGRKAKDAMWHVYEKPRITWNISSPGNAWSESQVQDIVKGCGMALAAHTRKDEFAGMSWGNEYYTKREEVKTWAESVWREYLPDTWEVIEVEPLWKETSRRNAKEFFDEPPTTFS